MLVDHAYTVPDRIAWRVEGDWRAAHQDGARVGTIEAGKDVHQSALAGSVLSQKRVDLSLAQVEVHGIVSQDAGKALGDSSHLDGVRLDHHGAPVMLADLTEVDVGASGDAPTSVARG